MSTMELLYLELTNLDTTNHLGLSDIQISRLHF